MFSSDTLFADSALLLSDIVVFESELSVNDEGNNHESVLELGIFVFSAINDEMFNDLIETILTLRLTSRLRFLWILCQTLATINVNTDIVIITIMMIKMSQLLEVGIVNTVDVKAFIKSSQ